MQPLLSGMPKRLAILDYGLFQVNQDRRTISICGYLIQTTAGENVLIDSGFPPKYAEDAEAATEQDGLEVFGTVLELKPHNLAPAQLALLDIGVDDITLVIQSHTHIDHVGFLGEFPNAPTLLAADERALPRPLYWSGKQTMDWPDTDYLILEEDTVIAPGFEVLFVPGHAPGQLAFSIHLPKTGTVLLTSDAISRPAEFDTRFEGAWDADLASHHAKRLVSRAARDRAMLIYGHSPEQWPDLRKAPEWYD